MPPLIVTDQRLSMNEVNTQGPDMFHHLNDVKEAVRWYAHRDHEQHDHVRHHWFAVVVEQSVCLNLSVKVFFAIVAPIADIKLKLPQGVL